MLIYGVSVTFAKKKTVKQFLQPMIEKVWEGGGGGGGVNVPLFLGQFFRATIFLCRFFLNSRMPFCGGFYQYLHIFWLYIMCHKSQTVS